MVQIRILTSGNAMDPTRLFRKSCVFQDADRPMQSALRRRGIIRKIISSDVSVRTFSLASVAAVDDDVAVAPAIPIHSPRPRLEALRQKLQSEPPDVSRQIFKTPQVEMNSAVVVQSTKKLPLNDVSSHGDALDHVRTMLSQMPDPELTTLTDRHGRFHNYLRISVAERCNLRCTYCMPEQGVPLQPKEQLLSTPEILLLARTFVQAGVNKFRLTGGEPTLRADLVDIIAGLHQIDLHPSNSHRRSIGMTTNGIVLSQHLEDYHAAGLTGVNLSLDTLEDAKFSQLTRRPPAYLSRVWQSLDLAMELAQKDAQFTVKLNCVVMRGTNDQEIADFVRLTDQYPGLQVRFIEYMPFSDNGWNSTMCVPFQELLANLRQDPDPRVHLSPISSDDIHDTTKWFQTTQGGRIGFITSMSEHFCGTCNRLRLTADGQIKVCLFDGSSDHNDMISLRDAVRANWTEVELRKLIFMAVQKKHAVLGGHTDPSHIMKDAANNRPMTLIGG